MKVLMFILLMVQLAFSQKILLSHPHTPDVVLFRDKHSDCIDDVRLAQQPKLVLNPSKVEFQDIEITDFELIDYHPDRDKIDPFDIAI